MELIKPQKVTITETYYEYGAIIDYIEKLHNIDVRDCGGMFHKDINVIVNEEDKGEHFDFWHWLLEEYSWITDDSIITFEIKRHLEDEKTPYWVKNILEKIYAEYPEDEYQWHLYW